MRGKRMWQTLRLWATLSVGKRTAYLKDQRIFLSMGENCSIMDRKVPLYAKLIRFGNNVHVASKVDFITHDISHVVLNHMPIENQIHEKIGCIDIGDNVFIGSNTTVLGNVRIGSNVIIAAGTLVNRDILDNSVVAGVPARVVGTFDDFVQKRLNEETYPDQLRPRGQEVSPDLVKWCWDKFEADRS